jgi:virulence-associated protein VagC
MSFKLCRKPFRIGASQAVTLPFAWCQYYGNRIDTLTIFGDRLLIIAPKGLEEQAAKLIQHMEESIISHES